MMVHLTTQGARVHLHQGRLHVVLDHAVLARLPLNQIREVVVWGNVGWTTPALLALAARGIPVIFLTRRGRFRAVLHGPETPHVALRRAQYAATASTRWVVAMSRDFVAVKLRHQRVLLQRRRRRHGPLPAVDAALDALQRALEALPRKSSPNSLRGLEGRAARLYFQGLRALLRPECGLQGRTRRPPRDPANALLSLGYTLLTQRAQSAARAVGLDPYAGFLHGVVYGRPALALDLAEEFRPVVDGLLLALCNARRLTPDDFEPTGTGGWRLRDAALPRFLHAFEHRWARLVRPAGHTERRPLGQWLMEQARQVARRLRDDDPGFRGLGFRG